ncbi:unnamed protein product [Cylindrotheca closterium]|uniref:DUF6824 domain-containing protein n=1 Tax=Cylindrotheca closterium TaxID=2856 RepID=A0AAD2FNI2_9STRA|nr:unnamed protein product [Cylindrotheca closterium]
MMFLLKSIFSGRRQPTNPGLSDPVLDDATARALVGSVDDEITDPRVVDSMVVQAISKSTTNAAERACFDAHDMPGTLKDTPELIERALSLLDIEIHARYDNHAYILAESMNPSFVKNRDFRLMFLLADNFNVKKAALRIVRHFQVKLDLFGKERIASNITQDDLDKDTFEGVYNGHMQVLPQQDHMGRTVYVFVAKPATTHAGFMMKMRRMFYFFMAYIQNVEGQKKDAVALVFYMQNEAPGLKESRFESIWKAPRLIQGMPIKMPVVHLGSTSTLWSPAHSVLKVALNVIAGMQLCPHYGSFDDCIRAMKDQGIDTKDFPLDGEGNVATDKHHESLEALRRKERQVEPKRNRVHVPGSYDVLFGKGSPLQNHRGNIKFRGLIADCRKAYEKADKDKKRRIIEEIVSTVRQSSGLFLKADGDGSWIDVDDRAACVKVGSLFRTLRFHQDGGGKAKRRARAKASN